MSFTRKPGRLRLALAAVAAALLVACGGGTSQYETFVAERVIVFGDETTLLSPDGRKYSINGTVATDDLSDPSFGTIDCSSLPNFAQTFAAFYGFVFAECSRDASVAPRAFMRAIAGARVEDIPVQIDAQIANGGFRDKDVTTMLAGANDVLDLYAQYPGRGETEIADDLRARGRQLATQVNRLVGFGVKVIVITIPDIGLTPFALRQRLEFSDTDRAALLSRLTAAFNEQLGANIELDGRFIGLVQGDLRTQQIVKSPGSFNVSNVNDAACDPTIPLVDCSNRTLVPNAIASSFLWADETHLAYIGQQQLASLAIDRARRNPF